MTLSTAIVGHPVGDYLLQNDWMALNKKKATIPCVVHCTLWTLSVCAFTGWWIWSPVPWVTHFIQDRTNIILFWMTRVNRQLQFASGPCAPWSIIVVDNTWHILTLWAIWKAGGGI